MHDLAFIQACISRPCVIGQPSGHPYSTPRLLYPAPCPSSNRDGPRAEPVHVGSDDRCRLRSCPEVALWASLGDGCVLKQIPESQEQIFPCGEQKAFAKASWPRWKAVPSVQDGPRGIQLDPDVCQDLLLKPTSRNCMPESDPGLDHSREPPAASTIWTASSCNGLS